MLPSSRFQVWKLSETVIGQRIHREWTLLFTFKSQMYSRHLHLNYDGLDIEKFGLNSLMKDFLF